MFNMCKLLTSYILISYYNSYRCYIGGVLFYTTLAYKFRKEIGIAMISKLPRKRGHGRSSSRTTLSSDVPDINLMSSNLGTAHIIDKYTDNNNQRLRCLVCNSTTNFACTTPGCKAVCHPDTCFKAFHEEPAKFIKGKHLEKMRLKVSTLYNSRRSPIREKLAQAVKSKMNARNKMRVIRESRKAPSTE